MDIWIDLPIDVEEVAFQIAQHDDATVVAFIKTILDEAARIELDEMLVAHVWRGVMREYAACDVGVDTPSIEKVLEEHPE